MTATLTTLSTLNEAEQIAHQAFAENSLSMALWHLRHTSDDPTALERAAGRAMAAVRRLQMACAAAKGASNEAHYAA